MDIKEKCRKLFALAQRGEAGERQNAKRLLNSLMAQHGLTTADIQEVNLRLEFRYKQEGEKVIISQCLFSLGLEPKVYQNSKAKIVLADVLQSEWASTKRFVEAHLKQYRKEAELLIEAYVNKHDLFSEKNRNSERTMTDEEIKEAREILRRAAALSDIDLPPTDKKLLR